MASTAEELSGQSEQLAEMIAYFKVDSVMSRKAVNQSYQSSQQGPEGGGQQKIAHVKSKFADKQDDAVETSGHKDALDNDFEEY